jgi:NADPH2:quinone reductase
VVEKIGPGVADFAPGDEVYDTPEVLGNQRGTYAALNVVAAAIVARKLKNLDYYSAPAIPLAGGTVWEALVCRLQIRLGELVLIHGGAGGLGSFGVQIAKTAGAWVLATAGNSNQQTLRDLKVDLPIDYSKEDVIEVALRVTGGKGVDVVFDTVGGDLVGRSVHATRPLGRLACILPPGGDTSLLYARSLTLHGIFLTRERRRLEEICAVIDQGKLRPIIDEVIPFEEVANAHKRLDSGYGTGKIVLRIE